MPCGVKLEEGKGPSLENGIVSIPAPRGLPAPKMFAPLKKKPGAAKILAAARSAGIADELDGAELERKLSRLAAAQTAVLVAVCFDDDPLATCEQAVLRENAEQVAAGLELAAQACGAAEKRIAAASREEIHRVAGQCPGVRFLVPGDRYPALAILRRKLAAREKKAAFLGAQACAALAAAVLQGRAQSETVVTVAGDGVGRWLNCRARIGTPIGALLDAGGLDRGTSAVVVGSSVAGRSVTDLSEPVTPETRCVVAMKKPPRRRPLPCIGCGRCGRACPRGILPWMILQQLESETPDPFRLFNVERCIRCAACSIVCPSEIDLAAAVRRAAEVKEGGGTRGAE